MGLGLLGALGGLGKAGSDIADQTMRERANDDHLRKLESMRIAAEERAVGREDARDARKLALEDARITQRRGLLGEVLGQMPKGASDYDISRALLDAGLIDEAKAYADLGKAGDNSEYRMKNLELQHEKRLAAIENTRLRLEAAGSKPRDVTFDEYEKMPPERRKAYDDFKGRRESNDYVPTIVKDMRAFDSLPEPEKVRMWDATLEEETAKNQRSGNVQYMKGDAARKAAEQAVTNKLGPRPGGNGATPSTGAPVDLNQFFKK